MDNVACVGQETSLADCTKTTYTFEEAKQFARNSVNVVSLTCNTTKIPVVVQESSSIKSTYIFVIN